MSRILLHAELRLSNYIAHPFWPEVNAAIDIEKKSGVNRQKSEEKRRAALQAECGKRGLTLEDYEKLKAKAKDQWYRNAAGFIVVPRHHLAGSLVQTIGTSPKGLRGAFDKDNFRALVQIGDFATELRAAAGVFSRFAKLEGSNQRSFQENEFIGRYLDVGEPFAASGTIECDERDADTVKALVAKAVEITGVGASRKMGFGRGTVKWNSKD